MSVSRSGPERMIPLELPGAARYCRLLGSGSVLEMLIGSSLGSSKCLRTIMSFCEKDHSLAETRLTDGRVCVETGFGGVVKCPVVWLRGGVRLQLVWVCVVGGDVGFGV